MKTAFVIPFYGTDIGGGAEMQCRRLAENLVERGADVEILTTTLRDLTADWNSPYYDPGVYKVNGVTVRRFHARPTNSDVFNPVNEKIIARADLSIEDELDYSQNAVNSDALFEFIGENKKDYVYFFIPYLFGTSINGTAVAPEKSVLIPCLHDEGYAALRVIRQMFDRASAALFNSRAEMRLAESLYGGLKHTVPILMGEGVDQFTGADGQRFREKHGLGDTPFILYVGRRDATKNTPLLVDYFRRYRKMKPERDLKLVLMGPAAVPIPSEIEKDTLDLGFVPVEEKRDALAAATILCQPSLMESFSLVIMESWLCGRPVLVHSRCGATTDHALDSGGGLPFGSFPEFYEAADLLIGDPELADRMGRKGREYVLANFSWDVICDRFMKLMDGLAELETL